MGRSVWCEKADPVFNAAGWVRQGRASCETEDVIGCMKQCGRETGASVHFKNETRVGGRGSRRGFTLIESLGALALLALAVPVLVLILSDAADRTRRGQSRVIQREIAERLLSLAMAGAITGRTSGSDAGCTWEVETRPLPEQISLPKDTSPLHVRVSVSDQKSRRPYILETLFFMHRS